MGKGDWLRGRCRLCICGCFPLSISRFPLLLLILFSLSIPYPSCFIFSLIPFPIFFLSIFGPDTTIMFSSLSLPFSLSSLPSPSLPCLLPLPLPPLLSLLVPLPHSLSLLFFLSRYRPLLTCPRCCAWLLLPPTLPAGNAANVLHSKRNERVSGEPKPLFVKVQCAFYS